MSVNKPVKTKAVSMEYIQSSAKRVAVSILC